MQIQKSIAFLYLIVIINIISSCFDMFNEEEKHLIGNISVINQHNAQANGYFLILYESGVNHNIIESYVTELSGNDTLLLIKAVNSDDCNVEYYTVHHSNGKRVTEVKLTNRQTFENAETSLITTIRFISEFSNCP